MSNIINISLLSLPVFLVVNTSYTSNDANMTRVTLKYARLYDIWGVFSNHPSHRKENLEALGIEAVRKTGKLLDTICEAPYKDGDVSLEAVTRRLVYNGNSIVEETIETSFTGMMSFEANKWQSRCDVVLLSLKGEINVRVATAPVKLTRGTPSPGTQTLGTQTPAPATPAPGKLTPDTQTPTPGTHAPATPASGTQIPTSATPASGTQTTGTQIPTSATPAPGTQTPAPATPAPGTQTSGTHAPGTQTPATATPAPGKPKSDTQVNHGWFVVAIVEGIVLVAIITVVIRVFVVAGPSFFPQCVELYRKKCEARKLIVEQDRRTRTINNGPNSRAVAIPEREIPRADHVIAIGDSDNGTMEAEGALVMSRLFEDLAAALGREGLGAYVTPVWHKMQAAVETALQMEALLPSPDVVQPLLGNGEPMPTSYRQHGSPRS